VKRTESATEIPASEIPATFIAGPSRAEIALLAYSFWESRGYQGGSPEEDWLRAEEQLNAHANAANV
jgi:hypothetical protein